MLGVLILIISLFGKIATQQTLDSMERPLLGIATPLLQPSSRPLLAMDQHVMDSSGLPVKPIFLNPRQIPSSPPPLPPQSPLQPMPRPSSRIVPQRIDPQRIDPQRIDPQRIDPQRIDPQRIDPQRIDPQRIDPQRIDPQRIDPQRIDPHVPLPRQPAQSDGLLRVPFQLESSRQPQLSNSPVRTVLAPSSLGILNRDRIHVEGFQPIERRFISTKRKRSPVIIGDSSTFDEDVKDEDFLPVETSGRRLSALELFDQSESEVTNAVASEEGSANFQNVSRSDYMSSRSLRPESGYQISATRLSKGISKFHNMSNNIISRVQQEGAEEENNSIVDQEGGSGFSEEIDVSTKKENVIEESLLGSFLEPVEVSEENKRVAPIEFGTLEEPLISNSTTAPRGNVMSIVTVPATVELPSTPAEERFFVPTASSNSVPFVRDSKLLRIVKEYAGLIVGCILGIPAIVVLCYFLYLKRLKRYTGTLDVSPRQRACYHKKSESRKTICSEENELACSPSTSTSKTPQPPPFPNCKKYVP